MPELPENFEDILRGISVNLGEILREQKMLGERMGNLEERIFRFEEKEQAPEGASEGVSYDYRILEHYRRYTIWDSKGHKAEMTNTRSCLALRDMPGLRTRYHTGTGERNVAYSYRIIQEGQAGEADWVPLEFEINRGAGADYSAILAFPQPILRGDRFELRHEIELVESFCTHNEWVSIVVEYPTERFVLELILPSGRMIQGARSESSDGASQSFDKRRIVPQKVPGESQVMMVWEEARPVTARTYTLYWEW
jgi:hypothetical protein